MISRYYGEVNIGHIPSGGEKNSQRLEEPLKTDRESLTPK